MAAPVEMARAASPPAVAPAGQAALEKKDATGTGGKLARTEADEGRATAAAEFAAAPPALLPEQAELAAKPVAAPKAAAFDAARPGAVSLQKGVELSSNEAAAAVVVAPGGFVRWRLAAGGRIWRSTDAGETWRQQVSGTSAALVAGSATSSGTCWIVGAGGTVLLTLDGERWGRLPFPFPIDLTGVHARDARAATVVAADGRRFDTFDAGLTWK